MLLLSLPDLIYSDVVSTSFAAAKELLQFGPPPHRGDAQKVSLLAPDLQPWVHFGPGAM